VHVWSCYSIVGGGLEMGLAPPENNSYFGLHLAWVEAEMAYVDLGYSRYSSELVAGKTLGELDMALVVLEGRHIHDSEEVPENCHNLGLVE
jgi:hypothetical protein